ncbi:hypothetical protein [Prescottella subtropica]|uniref:hypothetical protein n=1 Tax=Prescottella subtropica TaxID=2545757 RepID=UPI0010F55B6C|nr:hypothetical protein [Prescottella subtropica]
MTKRYDGPIDLLAAILRDRQNLPAALCIGRHQLFDQALHPDPGTPPLIRHQARQVAETLCSICAERQHCHTNLTPARRTA